MNVSKTGAHIPVEVALNTLKAGDGFFLPSDAKIHVLTVDGNSAQAVPCFDIEGLVMVSLDNLTSVVQYDLAVTVTDHV